MSIIGWVILGLIAGYIASKIVNRTGEGFVVDILLGIGGAVVGGWLFHSFGMWGVNGVNPCSSFFTIGRSWSWSRIMRCSHASRPAARSCLTLRSLLNAEVL